MGDISRYVSIQLAIATFAITVGLTFAVWLTQSLRLIDYIVNRGLPATTFLMFVALLLPSFLGIVLPIAAFCAVLFVFHKMIMDSELVALRAAGLSQMQLARPALLLGIAVTLLVYSITLYFLPMSFRAFKELQHKIRNDSSSVVLQEGTFNTIADGITVYLRERASDGELFGLLVHDDRDSTGPVTMMAERGVLVRGDTGPRVIMINGNRQQAGDDGRRLSLLYFDRYTVELSQFRETVHTRWREPKERFLTELFRSAQDTDDRAQRRELLAEGHQRLVSPLYCLSFVLIALAALLSGEFNRRGEIRRVVSAVLCVALLEGLALALQDLVNRSLSVLPAMYAAAILPGLASLYVLHRRPRGRAVTALQTGVSAT